MIPLAVPNLSGNEKKYLIECVDSTFVSSVGQYVTRFEKMIAELSGAQFGVATSAGTTGLHAALVAVGVRPNDLVIVPSFTFIASANAITHSGAMPWFFDVDPNSWTLDPKLLAQTLKDELHMVDGKPKHKATGKAVSAMMPVHILGAPCDIGPLMEISKEYGIPVVADGAAALGATYNNQKLGGLADLTVYSFNGNKTVTAGGGGAIVGNNQELLKLVKHLTTTARVGQEYHHDLVGFNYRMTNLQAAVGCAQLEQLEGFVEKKRAIQKTYNEALKDCPHVSLFPEPKWAKSGCWFSGVLIDEHSPITVSEICTQLQEQDIQARTFWKPVHLQPPYQTTPKTTQTVCESLWEKVLTLPCSTNLTKEEQNKVIEALKKILG